MVQCSLLRVTNDQDSGNSSPGSVLALFSSWREQSSFLCSEILGLGVIEKSVPLASAPSKGCLKIMLCSEGDLKPQISPFNPSHIFGPGLGNRNLPLPQRGRGWESGESGATWGSLNCGCSCQVGLSVGRGTLSPGPRFWPTDGSECTFVGLLVFILTRKSRVGKSFEIPLNQQTEVSREAI